MIDDRETFRGNHAYGVYDEGGREGISLRSFSSVCLDVSPSLGRENILTAWAVVTLGYYSPTKVSFFKREGDGGGGLLERVCLDVEAGWSIGDLRGRLSQLEGSGADEHQSSEDGSGQTAVCFFDGKGSTGELPGDYISHLAEKHGISLIMTFSSDEDESIITLYSPNEHPCPFDLHAILDSMNKVLHTIQHDPSQTLSEIDVISNHDLQRLKNWTVSPPPNPKTTIHSLINKHYHATPSKVAISSTTDDITYEELGKRSAAMARKVQDMGVGPGSVVGFCLAKSALSMVVLVAILRAGAGYVPVATSCPGERLEFILEKAGVEVVVAEGDVIARLGGQEHGRTMVTPEALDQGDVPIDWADEIHDDPSQVAYIMFTSGSTGNPKGVVHEQGAVAGSLEAVSHSFGLDPSTRFLQFASYSFDASICELFAPLVSGGTVCVPTDAERVEDLEGAMQTLQVTDASLTPVVITSLSPGKLPMLRSLYIGGEAPTAPILKDWAGKVRLNNIYGTTEAGVWDTVQLDMKVDDEPRTIGKGIGTSCWIVDPENIHRLRPVGVEGELILQSPYLARGYLDNASQQSSAFVDVPGSIAGVTGSSTGRCYRTGDLARLQPDGTVVFRGRSSGFVKIRGLRVELGEIETVINGLLDHGRAAVIVTGKDTGSPELVAFVEGADTLGSLADEMHAALQSTLPSYMVPSIFVPVDVMPLTDSKKVDRQRLRTQLSKMGSTELMAMRPGGSSRQNWAKIDPNNRLALELSNIIANMVDKKDPSGGDAIRGWDFPLSSVGLDSVQLAFLSGSINRTWDKKVRIEVLQQPSITISQISQHLTALDEGNSTGLTPTHLQRDLMDDLNTMDLPIPISRGSTKTIFLTSITGFLGSQVLRALLEHPDVDRIIGLVRASNQSSAREKVRSNARLGKWWRDEFDARIDIWLGDLSLPRLGLDDTDWESLTGRQRIDGIIHNGASVNWMDDFTSLKATNVDSTKELLSALSNMPVRCPLTYVGGGYLPEPGETREQSAEKLSSASGYDQTKFLSRVMVDEYNRHLDQTHDTASPRGRVIQPGFLAGTRWEGVAHPDDFLWRLAYSILSLGCVSDDLGRAHIPVAGVDQMATLIANSVLNPQGKLILDCHDGVTIDQLCKILTSRTGRSIHTANHEEWVIALKADVEDKTFHHPFLPLLEWFETNAWQFMGLGAPKPVGGFSLDRRDIVTALERSTEYLVQIGFLSGREGVGRGLVGGLFRRNK